ncbi:hypothetical protein ACE1ET_07185 [Saccharicrinis sp. FJH62]
MIIVAIISVQPYTTLKLGNTTIWWLVETGILLMLWYGKSVFFDRSQSKSMFFIQLYLFWNVFSFFHGIYMAEIYWDVKALLNNTFALLLPLFAYLGTNIKINQILLSKYLKIGIPIFFLYLPFISPSAYGDYLAPFSLLALFIPGITMRDRGIIAVFAFLVSLSLGARSEIIKLFLAIILSFIYYFRQINLKFIFAFFRLILLFAPVILLALALSGIFNPFAMNEYIKGDYETISKNKEGKEVKENLTADTRTAIYLEVLLSAKKHNSWWIGRSPARGNDTEIFGNVMEKITGRRERNSNEVSILNIFTWTGIIGVFIYFLVFFRATYLAIHKSSNIFSKILGLYIAFRWAYAWVEEFNVFNLNYLTLWMMIGLCMSQSFRAMNNEDVKIWIRGVFDRRYRFLVEK